MTNETIALIGHSSLEPSIMALRCLSLLVMALTATLAANGEQPTRLNRHETDYFSIGLPQKWSVKAEQPEDEKSSLRTFSVSDSNSENVFVVTVETSGPEFVQCFCAPWKDYKQYERDGLKYADLTMDSVDMRTLKAAGRKYSTDIHLTYGKADRPLLDSIIESVRPF